MDLRTSSTGTFQSALFKLWCNNPYMTTGYEVSRPVTFKLKIGSTFISILQTKVIFWWYYFTIYLIYYYLQMIFFKKNRVLKLSGYIIRKSFLFTTQNMLYIHFGRWYYFAIIIILALPLLWY